jgi:hypothetical protein
MLATDASNTIKGCLLVGTPPDRDLLRAWSKDQAAEVLDVFPLLARSLTLIVVLPPVSPSLDLPTSFPILVRGARLGELQPLMTPVPRLRRDGGPFYLVHEQGCGSNLAATA